MLDLSIVIPVKNEGGNIIPLISEIHAALDGMLDYEIVYVDDGSTDATASEIRTAQLLDPHLRLVRHAKSCGQSTAVHSGVRAAYGRWIATLDGDGQNDPADIPTLWRIAASEPDNSRLLLAGHRARRKDTTIKRFSSRFANRIRAGMLGDATPDSGCGLKLFERGSFLALPYFDHMHRFLPALFIRAGGRVQSVRVNHRPRARGSSNYGTFDRLWVGITDLFGVMWLQKRSRIPVFVAEPEGTSQPADHEVVDAAR